MSAAANEPVAPGNQPGPFLQAISTLVGSASSTPGRLNLRSSAILIIAFLLTSAAVSGMFLHVFYQPSAEIELAPDGQASPYLTYEHPDFGRPADLDKLNERPTLALTDTLVARQESAGAVATDASLAFLSVWREIVSGQPYGAYIRHVHRQSTGLLFIILPLYLVFVLLDIGAGKKIAAVLYTALGLCVLVLLMGFSGSLLTWSMAANSAAAVAASFLSEVPLLGDSLAALFSGGSYVGRHTLGRAFSLHTAWIPVLILALVIGRILTKGPNNEKSDASNALQSRWIVFGLLLVGLVCLVYQFVFSGFGAAAFAQSAANICVTLALSSILSRRLPELRNTRLQNSDRVKHFALSAGTLLGLVAFGLFLQSATPSVEAVGELIAAEQGFTPGYMQTLEPAWFLAPLKSAASMTSGGLGAAILLIGAIVIMLYPWVLRLKALRIAASLVLLILLGLAAVYIVLGMFFGAAFGTWNGMVLVLPTLPNAEAWMLPLFMALLSLVIAAVCHGLNHMLLQQQLDAAEATTN